MEGNRKRQRPGDSNTVDEVAIKRATPAEDDDDNITSGDDEDMTAWLSIDEDAFSELSNLLETEASLAKVNFISDPYSSPLIFQSSSSYVTINGNEESCGSSFSDSESSVMASIDLGGNGIGVRGRRSEVLDGGAWGSNCKMARGVVGEGKRSDGWDCSDGCDEMLARSKPEK